MKDINEFYAGKCGIEQKFNWFIKDSTGKVIKGGYGEFDIDDPRCREIIREHYGLATDKFQGGEWSCFPREKVEKAIEYMGKGKTIAEAEIACLQAIHEKETA